VVVDAENGSVWRLKNRLAASMNHAVNASKLVMPPHLSLLKRLEKNQSASGLRRAIFGGSVLKSVGVPKLKPEQNFSYKVTERDIPFAFDAKKRELYWEIETKGKWSGVKLSKDEAERLSKWLKTAKL
jgi:hypothetical protein